MVRRVQTTSSTYFQNLLTALYLLFTSDLNVQRDIRLLVDITSQLGFLDFLFCVCLFLLGSVELRETKHGEN